MIYLLTILCVTLMIKNYPQHLNINDRKRLPTTGFRSSDKLYRGFVKDDLEYDENIGLYSINFPDLSFNWGRFSNPEDIRFRPSGKMTDGCYSITVEITRYKKIATPVHDPIEENGYENYSHVEVRELYNGEDINTEPPKGRKRDSKGRKAKRLAYRQNMINKLEIEIEPF